MNNTRLGCIPETGIRRLREEMHLYNCRDVGQTCNVLSQIVVCFVHDVTKDDAAMAYTIISPITLHRGPSIKYRDL